MERREFLSGTFLLCSSLSGCTELKLLNSSPVVDDLTIINEMGEPKTVTIEVTWASAQEIVLAETRVIPTGEKYSQRSVVFPDPIKAGGVHHVEVTVENGPSGAYDWGIWGDEEQQDESHALDIHIYPTKIEFIEGAA